MCEFEIGQQYAVLKKLHGEIRHRLTFVQMDETEVLEIDDVDYLNHLVLAKSPYSEYVVTFKMEDFKNNTEKLC